MHFTWIKKIIHIFFGLIFFSTLYAQETYPNKPINIIVGFEKGGSTDSLARAMAPYLSEILNVPIHIHNIQGLGSVVAVEAFLKANDDGYTILCSAFSPFLPIATLRKHTDFDIDDLSYLNIQSYGNDMIAVSAKSSISSLSELLETLRSTDKKLKIAVVENSSGFLLLRLILKEMNVPVTSLVIHEFNSDYNARDALLKGDADAIFVSSGGCELIRDKITPLAINASERQLEWDVPTVNEALIPLGFKVPSRTDYMRGFAVHKSLKEKYPERYEKLHDAFLLLMAKKSVQRELKKNKVGGTWTGSENSTQLIHNAFENLRQYHYLLEP